MRKGRNSLDLGEQLAVDIQERQHKSLVQLKDQTHRIEKKKKKYKKKNHPAWILAAVALVCSTYFVLKH